jgi:hypothetical protein
VNEQPGVSRQRPSLLSPVLREVSARRSRLSSASVAHESWLERVRRSGARQPSTVFGAAFRMRISRWRPVIFR